MAQARVLAKGRLLEIEKARVAFLFPNYCLDLLYPPMKCHESIPLGLRVMTQAQILTKGR